MAEEYMVDAYYGLIYSKDKAKEAEKYKTDDVRYLRRKTREVLAQSDANLIDTLYVHPIGNKCLGNCVYCMNESFNSTATVEKLSMDRYRNTLKYLVEKNYITDTVTISLTGGEPVLSDDLVNVLDISIEELEQVFSYVITTGMFYSDERFKYLMDISEDMRQRPIENLDLSFSVDLDNSANRYSSVLKFGNIYIKDRLYAHIPELTSKDKVLCGINIRLNNDSNLSTMLDNMHKFLDAATNKNKILFRLSIVDGPDHYLSADKVPTFFDELHKNFKLSFSHKGSFTLEITSKDSEIEDSFNNLMLMTLEDGIYVLHPLDQPCWTWSKFLGIGPSKYFACYFGFMESDNIDDLVVMTKDNKYYSVYNKLGEGCAECELLPFCKLCMRQRLSYPCTKIPALKEYMKEVFKIMISDPHKWCVI